MPGRRYVDLPINSVAYKIKSELDRREISNQELARLIGQRIGKTYSAANISHWLKGDRPIPRPMLRIVEQILEVNLIDDMTDINWQQPTTISVDRSDTKISKMLKDYIDLSTNDKDIYIELINNMHDILKKNK